MSALTKANLAESLSLELCLNKVAAKELVDVFFATIQAFLEEGDSVKLAKLGHFDLRDKKARPGRNPKTLEAKEIAARRVVTFHAGQKLKTLVQEIAIQEESA